MINHPNHFDVPSNTTVRQRAYALGKYMHLSTWPVFVGLFLLYAANLFAQIEVPPIVSDSIWTYTHQTSHEAPPEIGPSLALAEDANMLFYSTRRHNVFVLKANTGRRTDTIDLRPIFEREFPRPQRIYSNADGSRLVVMWLDSGSIRISVISYPEKQLIKHLPYEIPDPWQQYFCNISPDGRFVVAPWLNNNAERYALYDLERDTMFTLITPDREMMGYSTVDFDDASTKLVFSESSKEARHLTIIDLKSGQYERTFIPGSYGSPVFSGDGNSIAVSADVGYGPAGVSWFPRVRVIDVATKQITWEITGSLEGVSDYRFDMLTYALTYDGKTAFVFRNDTADIEEMRTGMFYHLPDTIPFARCQPKTFGKYSEFNGCTVFSSDLTRGFMSADRSQLPSDQWYPCDVLAGSFDLTNTTVHESPRRTAASVIYPNPASSIVNIPWSSTGDEVSWSIASQDGKVQASGSASVLIGLCTIEIPQQLPRGWYHLQVTDRSRSRSVGYPLIVE